jgi:hypothetical protein
MSKKDNDVTAIFNKIFEEGVDLVGEALDGVLDTMKSTGEKMQPHAKNSAEELGKALDAFREGLEESKQQVMKSADKANAYQRKLRATAQPYVELFKSFRKK